MFLSIEPRITKRGTVPIRTSGTHARGCQRVVFQCTHLILGWGFGHVVAQALHIYRSNKELVAIEDWASFAIAKLLKPILRPSKSLAARAAAHHEDGPAPIGLLAHFSSSNVPTEPACLARDRKHAHATAIADIERVLVDPHELLGRLEIIGAHVLR